MEDYEHEAMLDSILWKREEHDQEPIKYVAPGEGQKWRARELFSFMWRHLGIKIPQGYRDVMLFLIEKANPNTGRVNWRQAKIANETGLSRDYVNEAFKWWASETPYLKTARRQNKDGWYLSSAYHIRWKKIDAAWVNIRENIDLMNSDLIHADSDSACENGRNPDVESDSATDVDSDSTTDVDSDSATRNTKRKDKVEIHPERAHQPRHTDFISK